jgi:hypothetical protein
VFDELSHAGICNQNRKTLPVMVTLNPLRKNGGFGRMK